MLGRGEHLLGIALSLYLLQGVLQLGPQAGAVHVARLAAAAAATPGLWAPAACAGAEDWATAAVWAAIRFGVARGTVQTLLESATQDMRDVVQVTESGLRILPEGRPATRLIAQRFDAYAGKGGKHSAAI